MKFIKFSLFILLVSIALVSCENEPLTGTFTDESGTGVSTSLDVGVTSVLLDKWWYDSANVTADVFFNSNGEYKQYLIVSNVEFTATGDWFWENEAAGIMKINNIVGNAQAVSEVWMKFTNIENSSFVLSQSTDGVDYSAFQSVNYQDTDN
jgi:hypothetical protein